MTYDADERRTLQKADERARSAWEAINEASTFLRRVHERHPLFYRANRILRDLEELRTELRRESGK